jgi:hypothetical protein
MPIKPENRHRYPKDWPQIRAHILKRAGNTCEWVDKTTGRRCDAPHGELIFRLRSNPERWRYPHGGDCGEADPEYRGVVVVLTIAHLNHTPEDNRDENLKALCQLHHLRYDAVHHGANAARTRRLKRRRANLELFEGAGLER